MYNSDLFNAEDFELKKAMLELIEARHKKITQPTLFFAKTQNPENTSESFYNHMFKGFEPSFVILDELTELSNISERLTLTQRLQNCEIENYLEKPWIPTIPNIQDFKNQNLIKEIRPKRKPPIQSYTNGVLNVKILENMIRVGCALHADSLFEDLKKSCEKMSEAFSSKSKIVI